MNSLFRSNKTSQYLLPIFKTLDTEFKTQLNTVVPNILKLSIEDIEYTTFKGETHSCLFILFDINGIKSPKGTYKAPEYSKQNFTRALKWFRQHPNYIDDYIYDDVLHPNEYVIVFKLPEGYEQAYEKFKKSQYSEMFTKEQLGKLSIPSNSKAYQVLTKNIKYIPVFQEIVDTTFGTRVSINDGRELEFPINEEEFI
jgi:hypothetical protein